MKRINRTLTAAVLAGSLALGGTACCDRLFGSSVVTIW